MSELSEEMPPSGLRRALATYAELGGPVEFVVFGVAGEGAPEYEIHKAAAIGTLHRLARRYPHIRRIQPDQVQGMRISIDQFVGPRFDRSSHRLLLVGQTPNHLNDHFYAGDEEKPSNVVRFDTSEAGLSYAFSDPPYRLHPPPSAGWGRSDLASTVNDLFRNIADEWFDDFSGDLVIYQWSTDWSDYFDAGNEWWGSFLWTVYNRAKGILIGVAASDTD